MLLTIKKSNVIHLAEEKIRGRYNFFYSKAFYGYNEMWFYIRIKLIESKIVSYLRKFSGTGKLISRIDRYLLKGKLLKCMYNRKRLLALQNYIECEAHRELVLIGLKGEIISE